MWGVDAKCEPEAGLLAPSEVSIQIGPAHGLELTSTMAFEKPVTLN